MKACLLFVLIFLISNLIEYSLSIRDQNILGSNLSFKLRDKIYETIREIEMSLFYKRKDDKKIINIIKEIILIINDNNNKNDFNENCENKIYDIPEIEDKNYNNCVRNLEKNSGFDLFYDMLHKENFLNVFVNFKNFVESVSKLDVNLHNLLEGFFSGLYSAFIKENIFLKIESDFDLLKEEFKQEFKGLIQSIFEEKYFALSLNSIYEKLKKIEIKLHDSCRFKDLIKKITNLDATFGSTLTAYRILDKRDEIFLLFKEVLSSVELIDFKRLGYSSGKIISIILDFN